MESSHHALGGAGAVNLANAVIEACQKPSDFKFLYPLDLSIKVRCARWARCAKRRAGCAGCWAYCRAQRERCFEFFAATGMLLSSSRSSRCRGALYAVPHCGVRRCL